MVMIVLQFIHGGLVSGRNKLNLAEGNAEYLLTS